MLGRDRLYVILLSSFAASFRALSKILRSPGSLFDISPPVGIVHRAFYVALVLSSRRALCGHRVVSLVPATLALPRIFNILEIRLSLKFRYCERSTIHILFWRPLRFKFAQTESASSRYDQCVARHLRSFLHVLYR